MNEIYLHIVARMADYMDTHPYDACQAKVHYNSLPMHHAFTEYYWVITSDGRRR